MIWCLHGAVGMAEDWRGLAAALAPAGLEVRAVDLWSYVVESGCSFDEFAEALCEEVRAEDEEPILLGYSLGGRLALHALLADPGLWSAGVIVSAHPGLTSERERILRMAADAEWAAGALRGDWSAFLKRWNGQGVLRDSRGEGLGDRYGLEGKREAVARGFVEWSLGKQADLRPRLGELSCPLCWMTGGEDVKFGRLAFEVAPLIAQGVRVVIPEVGHRVPWEAGRRFAGEVERFLAG